MFDSQRRYQELSTRTQTGPCNKPADWIWCCIRLLSRQSETGNWIFNNGCMYVHVKAIFYNNERKVWILCVNLKYIFISGDTSRSDRHWTERRKTTRSCWFSLNWRFSFIIFSFMTFTVSAFQNKTQEPCNWQPVGLSSARRPFMSSIIMSCQTADTRGPSRAGGRRQAASSALNPSFKLSAATQSCDESRLQPVVSSFSLSLISTSSQINVLRIRLQSIVCPHSNFTVLVLAVHITASHMLPICSLLRYLGLRTGCHIVYSELTRQCEDMRRWNSSWVIKEKQQQGIKAGHKSHLHLHTSVTIYWSLKGRV